MTRKMLCLVLVAGAALVAHEAQAKAPLGLKSITVSLPDSTRSLPDGPGLAVVRNNCLGCHSAGMITNQPTMPRAAWEAEVAKMRNVYKAPVDQKDIPTIIDYLTAVKGSK